MRWILPPMLIILFSCTETVVEPHYYDTDTVFVYADTVVIPIQCQINAVIRIKVYFPEGDPVPDAILSVIIDNVGYIGTMLYNYPGFDDNEYRFVMPAPQPVTVFAYSNVGWLVTAVDNETGIRYAGKNFVNFNTEDFKLTRWHNITIKEATRWSFEMR